MCVVDGDDAEDEDGGGADEGRRPKGLHPQGQALVLTGSFAGRRGLS